MGTREMQMLEWEMRQGHVMKDMRDVVARLRRAADDIERAMQNVQATETEGREAGYDDEEVLRNERHRRTVSAGRYAMDEIESMNQRLRPMNLAVDLMDLVESNAKLR